MTDTPEDLQTPFDAAVAILTIFRPTLLQSIRAIFAQDHPGRIQILIGVDNGARDSGMLDTLRAECPERMAITVVDTGYSTAQRNGGLYPTRYGGALRTAISYLANSRYVAFLDDDNWWEPSHISSLLRAIQGKAWAFSRRVLYDTRLEEVICRDEWESLGPGAGVYVKGFGGWVDTSCLMVDKIACHEVLPAWAMSRFEGGTGDDRMVFERLKSLPFGATGLYTAFYRIVLDGVHPYLLWKYRQAGVDLARHVPAELMPPDSVWEECARHDQAEAAAASAAKPQTAQPSRFVGPQYSITYPNR
jgi:hypothetical protein